ncbi:MAG: WecB/TagA/CpsF family glycosyltransferase [Chloroflexaceae bacterium]|nr:WecB/TagA/CpsF family glycosyltransferase [Chloroflexaceae bacterium]NJO04633.1 WecB/TagA/CpsF family glycosyltransferase [Chloroflexaceae bacterium]
MSFDTANILGVQVACVGTLDILRLVTAWIEQGATRTVTYVNAHCLNIASTDPTYHAILNTADLVYPDGISVVWVSRILGKQGMQKSTGADWIEQFCELATIYNWRVYILAGRPDIARRAAANLQARLPRLQIVGAYDGYFSEKSEQEVLHDIERTRPHILFVGMGTPRQESWLHAHRDQLDIPVCWAVGALFDYVAGVEPRVPAWMNMLALEWLWRLGVDPWGKWRRYIVGNPLFLWRVLLQLVRERVRR